MTTSADTGPEGWKGEGSEVVHRQAEAERKLPGLSLFLGNPGDRPTWWRNRPVGPVPAHVSASEPGTASPGCALCRAPWHACSLLLSTVL